MLLHKNNGLEALCFETVILYNDLFVKQELEFAFGANTGDQE